MGDAARGESGGIGSIASGSAARRPYSNQRCGFRVAKAGGVIKRLIALCLSQPLSLTSFDSSPAGEPFGAVQTRRTVPYPSRSDRFNGVTGGAGGPKGRNRNLPWPPCKKVIRKLAVLFYSLRPLVPLAATSLDREAFSAILYAKIFELMLWLEQGRLTHCRS